MNWGRVKQEMKHAACEFLMNVLARPQDVFTRLKPTTVTILQKHHNGSKRLVEARVIFQDRINSETIRVRVRCVSDNGQVEQTMYFESGERVLPLRKATAKPEEVEPHN